MADNSTQINNWDKEELRKKVLSSIRGYKQRRRTLRYTLYSGCMSVLIVMCWLYSFYMSNGDLTKYKIQLSNSHIDTSIKGVQLFIGDAQQIAIRSNNPSISIHETDITIANSKKFIPVSTKTINSIVTPYGCRATIMLPDSTKVYLNSGSKLIYSSAFGEGKSRRVYLEGEAIFEVTHNGQPFIVSSEYQDIKVLGTVFSVSAYLDDVSDNTVLKSGSVEIEYHPKSFFQSSNKIEIVPGTVAEHNKLGDDFIITAFANIDKYFAWRDGLFLFKKDNLGAVIKKLSRYYNVPIELMLDEGKKEETFSGRIDLRDNIDNTLAIIQHVGNFTYTKHNRNNQIVYILKSK